MRATSWVLAHERIWSDKPLVSTLATSVRNLDGRTCVDPKTLYPGVPFAQFMDVCLMSFGHGLIIPLPDGAKTPQ